MKKIIAGVDEVGRGSLVGPVYAAAVILDEKVDKKKLKDSKKLSKKNREILDIYIKKNCIWAIESASLEEIEKYLISHQGDPISDIREKIYFHFPSKYRCFLKIISEEMLSESALIKDLNGIEILSDFYEKDTKHSILIKTIKSSPEPLSLNQIVNLVQKSEPLMERRSILTRRP